VNIDTKPVSIPARPPTSSPTSAQPSPGVSALGVTTVRVTVSISPQLGTRSFQAGVALINADPATRYDLATGQIIVTLAAARGAQRADGSTLVANVDVPVSARARRCLPEVSPPAV